MEVGEPDAFGVQAVEVGRLQERVAVTGEITVAVVVRQQHDDIGFGRFAKRSATKKGSGNNHNKSAESSHKALSLKNFMNHETHEKKQTPRIRPLQFD